MSAGKRRRVAITGLGVVCPAGNDVASMWARLLEGRSCGAPITNFDASGFSTRIAAEVRNAESLPLTGDRKLLKFGNRSHRFALTAAEQAMADAGIAPTAGDAHRWGCVVGTGMMTVSFDELASVQAHAAPAGELEAARVLDEATANDPMAFCRSQSTAGVSLLMKRFGIAGYASSVHTACASGGQALGTALRVIRRGAADRVLAGGFDSMVSPVGLAGFCLLSAVSPDNDTPERASRPFDATRNGFLLGEGAGFVVLEAWELAVARGARIYAELAGDGNSLSSYRITDSHPSGDGPIQAMQRALRDAGAVAVGRRLPQRPRHVHAHERPQRGGGRRRGVRRRGRQGGGQLDQERDGPPDRGRGRGRGRRVHPRHPQRHASAQREPHRARPGLRAPGRRAGRAARAPRSHRPVELAGLRRQQQLPRVPPPRRDSGAW